MGLPLEEAKAGGQAWGHAGRSRGGPESHTGPCGLRSPCGLRENRAVQSFPECLLTTAWMTTDVCKPQKTGCDLQPAHGTATRVDQVDRHRPAGKALRWRPRQSSGRLGCCPLLFTGSHCRESWQHGHQGSQGWWGHDDNPGTAPTPPSQAPGGTTAPTGGCNGAELTAPAALALLSWRGIRPVPPVSSALGRPGAQVPSAA